MIKIKGLYVESNELFVTKNGLFIRAISCPNLRLHNEELFTAVISIRLKETDFNPSLRIACNFGQIPFLYSKARDCSF